MFGVTAVRREEPVGEPKPDGKPFAISKRLVWEAWLRPKPDANVDARFFSLRNPVAFATEKLD